MEKIKVANYIINKAIDMNKPLNNLQLNEVIYRLNIYPKKDFKPFAKWHILDEVYYEFCIWGMNRLVIKEESNLFDISVSDRRLVETIIEVKQLEATMSKIEWTDETWNVITGCT